MSSDSSISNKTEVILITAARNISFPDMRAVYNYLAVFLPIEYLYLSVFLPTTIVGVLLNMMCVFIFSRNRFRTPLYVYLSYVAYVGIVGNLTSLIIAIAICTETIEIANTYIGQWLVSYVYAPLYNMTFTAKFILDIVIVLDRIVYFKPHFKWLIEIKPYKIILAILSYAVLINFPYIYLLYQPVVIRFIKSSNNESFILNVVSGVRINLFCY